MSKTGRPTPKFLVIGLIFTLALFAGTRLITAGTTPSARADKAVRASWALMQQSGRYDFSSTVEQTTFPAPALANVGRSSSKETYFASGTSDLVNRTMTIGLWQNEGSVLNGRDVVEVKVEGDKAYGRMYQTDWMPIENFSTTTFAPGQDASAFLVAAENARAVTQERIDLPDGSQLSVARYAFDLDGPTFAAYIRDQMAAELQRAGKLPLSMNLGLSDEYQDMEGQGSLWVNAAGLPVRLQVSMKLAPSKSGEHIEISLSTDFFNHAGSQPGSDSLPLKLAGMIGLPTNSSDLGRLAALAAFSVTLMALCASAALFSRRRWVYAAVALLVCLSMLVSPLWQSVQAAGLSSELSARSQSAKAAKAEADAQSEQVAELLGTPWDPNLSPRASAKTLSLAAATGGEDSADSDGDGLTDAYENEYNTQAAELGYLVVDPAKADTDADGLDDGEELRLSLSPAQADTDHDSLPDLKEVLGYDDGNKTWYSNPLEKDTDGDGVLDGAECPQMADTPSGKCTDSDSDLIPDLFDTDDDGDLVPSMVDESPYSGGSEDQVFSVTNPFKLQSIAGLVSESPVFINYQVRPTNPVHLTYALNVLDWPSGDTDGQVQRVSSTTFASTGKSNSADVRGAYGDLRLTPMLEIKLTGTTLPLPLTNQYSFDANKDTFKSNFTVTASGSATSLRMNTISAGSAPVTVFYGSGDCSRYSGSTKLGQFNTGSSTTIPVALGTLANGGHVLVVKSGSEASVLACTVITATAHGNLTNQVVDEILLAKYGSTARQNTDNSVLVYAPLSLVSPAGSDMAVAFGATVPFTNQGSRFSGSSQEVRMVWLLNMLTDVCKPQPAGDTSTNWCDKDKLDRWYTDVPAVVHTYNETFNLTGLSVSEERGLDMAVVFENPATDAEPEYNDPIWMLAKGLQASFIAGRSSNGTSRDVSVAEIEQRFDPDYNSAIPAGDARLWGQLNNAFQVIRRQYSFSDEIYKFIENDAKGLFDGYYNTLPEAQRPTEALLLFAREDSSRSARIGGTGVTCAAATCSVNFNGLAVIVNATLNWSPYKRTGSDWQPYPLQDYLDMFEAKLRALDEYRTDDKTADQRDVIDGQIIMARLYMQSLYQGISKLVALNGSPIISIPDELNDFNISTENYHTTGRYSFIKTIVFQIAKTYYIGLLVNPNLMKSSFSFGQKFEGFFKALKTGIKDRLSSMNVAKGVVVGLVAAIVIASLIWSLVEPNSEGGRIAGQVLRVTLAVVSIATNVLTLYQGLEAARRVASASAKAAVIGLVVGLVITWGVFIAAWATSGASAGSIAVNNMAADAIAATCTLVLMAILASTGVGAIIVAIIGLIDGIIMGICAALGWDQLPNDSWQQQFFCIGITGWVTKIIKWTIYGVNFLVNYSDQNRLSFSNLDQGVTDQIKGMVASNKLTAKLTVTNSIELSDIPFDWKAAAYWWQYTGSNARSSGFSYKLQPAKTDIHSSVNRNQNNGVWVSTGSDKWDGEFIAQTDATGITMPAVGINRDPTIYFSEGSAIPVQECIAIPIPLIFFWILIPICWIRTEKASIHSDLSSSFTVDVFPETLDAFYALTGTPETGYKQSWAQDGTLKLPTLKDADGDGLMSRSFSGGNDPDDRQADSDGDTISDLGELREGTDPMNFDGDNDGLWDSTELLMGTSTSRKDSDGDGLRDDEELAGWFFTYGFTDEGEPLETMVYPDPTSADADNDGLTDFQERLFGFHPRAFSQANILDYELSTREHDSPVALLRLDEESSPMVWNDASGFGFSASCGDPATCPQSGTGRYSGAARFDGDDALALTTTAGSLSFAANRPFTLGAWVYRQGAGVLLSKWNEAAAGQQEVLLGLDTNGSINLTGASGTVTSTAAVPAEDWTHVAVRFDGATTTFFIDGSEAGSSAWSNNPTFADGSAPSAIKLGAYDGAAGLTGFFSGRLDEVAVFDRALSNQQIIDRMVDARYNFNDDLLRPGEFVEYTSVVENLLNSRFAYGLVSTTIDRVEAVVDWASRLLPRSFVLYPDNPVATGVNTATITDTLQIANDAASGPLTISQRVSAQIVDRRAESNRAELWLKLNEGSGAIEFEDSSGNMPPRTATCQSATCPAGGQGGLFNNAVKFSQGTAQAIEIASLGKMKLLNHGYTLSMWVKPAASASGTALQLLGSGESRLMLWLVANSDNSFVPTMALNGVMVPLTTTRSLIAGSWNHLAVTFDIQAGTLSLFANGALCATAGSVAAITPASGLTDAAAWLGNAAQGADVWLDDVRIFSRPLTTLDINRLAERPVMQLNMDNGIYTDISGYSQPVAAPTGGSLPGSTASAVGGTAMTPSGSSYLVVNGNSMLDLSDGAFTISTWVYPTSATSGSWEGIWGNRDYESASISASYPSLDRQNLTVRFGFATGVANGGYQYKTSGDVLSANSWNHLLVTFAPSLTAPGKYEYKLYVNGASVDGKVFDDHPGSGTRFLIGHSSEKFTTKAVSTTLTAKTYYDIDDYIFTVLQPYLNKTVDGTPTNNVWSGSGSVGATLTINKEDALTGVHTITYTIYEDDFYASDDYCGEITFNSASSAGTYTTTLGTGYSGTLTTSVARPSSVFIGSIDKIEIYRYALDAEQVYNLYSSAPITARLPLDDRPAADHFENTATIGSLDDGTCFGQTCPVAGAVGLINQAVRFDGQDDLITVDVDTTPDYMVSLWVNSTCENCGIYTLRATNGGVPTDLQQIYFRNGNVCTLTGTRRLCTRGGGFADGEWHHVVYANNGAVANLWLDGVIDNALPGAPRVVVGSNEQALLGVAAEAGHPALNGQLDDVRVFLYSQAEDVVAQLNRRAPVFLAHLDEADTAAGLQDATPLDWMLDCSSDACPLAGAQGRLGPALEFDGQNDAVTLRQAQFSAGAQSFSLSLWVNPSAPMDRPQTIWALGNAGNSAYRYALAIAPNSMSLCVLDGAASSTCPVDSNVELIANNWNHVTLAVQRSGASENYQLYINGYLDSTGASDTATLSNGLGKITLGGKPAAFTSQAGGNFAGKLDEVSLYEYLLNEIDIRDTFTYQMSEVEEHDSLTRTIDAELPSASFISYNADFPYLKEQDKLLQVDAADQVSGIAMVEMKVARETNEIEPQWQVAPVCIDSATGASFCPTFIPLQGDGRYILTFRAVDRTGNQWATPEGYDLFVDGKGPRIIIDQKEGSLQPARLSPVDIHTWTFSLSGSIGDEILKDGYQGSGVNAGTLRVTVYNENGEPVGTGTQIPTLMPSGTGYTWSLDYILPEKEPSGRLQVVVEASDNVENASKTATWLLLDASAPLATLESGTPPVPDTSAAQLVSADESNPILTGGSLTGSSDDTPDGDLPYMSEEGEGAAAGMARVQVAFANGVNASTLYNEPYPGGLLVWLPLDNADVPLDENGNPDPDAAQNYFLDISPYQIAGVCDTAHCPDVLRSAHKAGSAFYTGSLETINLGQQVDLAGRSFTASVWVQRAEAGHADPILWQGPVSMPDQRFLFGLDQQDHFVCGFGGSDLQTGDAFPETDWHHWACSFDVKTGLRTIYRDGIMVASDTANPVLRTNEDLYLGLAPVGSFKGALDELVILDHALDTAGVRDQYTGFQSIFHQTIDPDFMIDGDRTGDRSGYFQTATLFAADKANRIVAGQGGEYALNFHGSDRLAVDPNYSLRLDRGAFTQAAWVFPTGSGERGIFSELDENPEQRYPSLILTAGNALKVGFGDGYRWIEAQSGAGLLPNNAWSHVAASFDGQLYKVYVNGSLAFSTDLLAGALPFPADRFNIGHEFNGTIDEVMIFTRALSALEMQALSAQGWQEADLYPDDAWQAGIPAGLEGPYSIQVRGWDAYNHVRADMLTRNQWSGQVDTLAPRVTLSRKVLDPAEPHQVTYTFSVEDFMLDESSIRQNLCTDVTLEKVYNNSSWFLALGNNPPNSALIRISASCVSDDRTDQEVGIYACDAGGNCNGKSYLPLLTNHVYLPVLSMPLGATRAAQLQPDPDALREQAAGWQPLAEAVHLQAPGKAPEVGITTDVVGSANLRSMFTLNLRGWYAAESAAALNFRVLQGGEVIYEGQAALYEGQWNATWLFAPGSAPADGAYTLEVTLTDAAGQQAAAQRDITIDLRP